MMVVAVVGMCGTGKSVATEEFTAIGWSDVYFGGVTLEGVREKGLPITPDNEKMVREALRAEYGMAAYAIKLLPRILELLKKGNVIIDGLYSWSEYKYLKEYLRDQLQVLCIISDRALRYSRLVSRPVRPLSMEEAQKRDYAEIENLEKGGPIAIADKYIMNNGTKEELQQKVREYIRELAGMEEGPAGR